MSARLDRCLEPGLSVLVATVNRDNEPSCCRAIAISSKDNIETLTVYVPMATSQRIIQDIATTHRVAVAANHVIDHCATQLKGIATAARMATDEEMAYVKRHLEEFATILDTIGVPRRTTRNVAHWPAFAIDMRVEEIFDQTPGPNAGTRLR